MKPVKETPYTLFLREFLPHTRIPSEASKQASKKLKAGAPPEEIVAYLKGHLDDGDVQPPAKCLVVGSSRPFDDFPIVQFSRDVQAYVCGQYKDVPDPDDPTKTKRQAFGGLTKTERKAIVLENLKRKTGRDAWLQQAGIDRRGLGAQETNMVIDHALKRFDGVEVKVDNRNAKAQARLDRENEFRRLDGLPEKSFVPESAYNEEGRLAQPPGFNPNIYFVQSSDFRALCPVKDAAVLTALNLSYSLRPDQTIPVGKSSEGSVVDRLAIPKGHPGYIPDHQRGSVNPLRRRIRQRSHAKAAGIILGIVKTGADWVVFDLRGLLRSVRWRKVGPRNITPNELVAFFTGDPVVDPVRGIATSLYKERSIKKWSKSAVFNSRAPDMLLCEAPLTMVSCDIGETNPITAKVSYVTNVGGKLQATMKARLGFHDLDCGPDGSPNRSIERLRISHDLLEESIRKEAILALPPDQQAEIARAQQATAKEAQARVVHRFGVAPTEIPWDRINNRTTFIADAVLKRDPTSKLVWQELEGKKRKGKNGKVTQAAPQIFKLKDHWIARQTDIRPRVSDEVRRALNNKIWEIKRTHDGYSRLAKRKAEIARQLRNQLCKRARLATGVDNLVLNIEKLNIKGLTGKGKRSIGWEALFQPKRESRWMMQALHKALLEAVTSHDSVQVILSAPERTSTTCTKCGHVDKDNRDGEFFKCLKCGFTANTDFEIATDNLESVALTGRPMPKNEDCEPKSGVQETKGARRGKLPVTTADPQDLAYQQ